MGIGLFSVAQLTRHFQIITKTRGADFRMVADITLNMQTDGRSDGEFDAGNVSIWAESALDKDAHGTEILLLDLRKTTRDDASGMVFDPHFMGYQVSEQVRLRQLTAEIFVQEGLDNAVNIDRESFNFAHPHYQLIVKWLHSAIKQFTNKQKSIGKELRENRREKTTNARAKELQRMVIKRLKTLGVRNPDFVFARQRAVVFVDGCFWHGCLRHSKPPKSNQDYWQAKMLRNKKRDRLVARVLRSQGWHVLRIWEHELLRKNEAHLLRRIQKALCS
jgi:DNA mismatch endonuclease Vsr